MNVCNTFSKKKKKKDFKAEPLMFLDHASHMKSLYSTSEQYFLKQRERTFPSFVSILKSFTNGHFLKVVIDQCLSNHRTYILLGLRGKERVKSFVCKHYIINLKNICLSSYINTFTLCA